MTNHSNCRRHRRPCAGGILAACFVFALSASAGEPSGGTSEKAQVAAVLAGQQSPATAKFAAAVRRVRQLGGQFEFDAAGRLVGVDLSSGRVSATDADLARVLLGNATPPSIGRGSKGEGGSPAAMPHLASLKLSGAGITNAGIRQIASIPGLRELSLLDAQIDNDGLRAITGLRQLTP